MALLGPPSSASAYVSSPSGGTIIADSLQSRWGMINRETSRFCEFIAALEATPYSGTTGQYKIENAKVMYKEKAKKDFPFEHCWHLLKHQPKWSMPKEYSRVVLPPAQDSISIADGDDVSLVDDTTNFERPIAKEMKVIENLQEQEKESLHIKAERVQLEELRDRERIRLEELRDRDRVRFEEKRIQMEEERLRIEREKLHIKSLIEDERIMSLDTSGITYREYVVAVLNEIISGRKCSSRVCAESIVFVFVCDFCVVMPYRVRENLFIGNISDAAEILQNGSTEITHILSVLSSVSISFFSEWRSSVVIPAKEIKKVYAGGGGGGGGGDGCSGSVEEDSIADGGAKSSLSSDKILYSLEYAGKDLKLVRMAVPIRDMESEDLLDYLDVCFDFIDRNRKEGSVLVHCFAGVSRSAAIITAYLMRTEHLSQEDALESLKQSCEFVCPNDGFIEQLKMFEEMDFKVDRASPIYKRFRLKVLGESYNRGEKIESSKFGADPGLATEVSSEVEVASNLGNNRSPAYRCKKCRRVVALQENVVDHIPGEGETSFEWRKRKSGNPYNKSEESECSSIFVEPLQWMTAVKEGAMEGKLSCAHCEARLGFFNWSGIQCSCGSWITPAFQIHKSRVDISTV
ncbi:hypothetical protein SO802_032077 [Lithocarpus litseifolius]|uniref:protein-tyrosine-phosphatase n=1 Tax=Lithocarpus litseifolius TaxID=425828 RepID=A0AAW2BMD1_9ROSI